MKPILDWSAYTDAGLGDAYADIPKQGADFAKAVAVCINSHRCEAMERGVMCPSYRVSGRGELSTGGRVRLLKAALNSDPSGPGLADEELAQAMDLCVACKGCKRECENAVDMTMIKAEYLAQQHLKRAPSLRTRLLAGLPRLLHRFSLLKRLPGWRNRSLLLARLTERFLGLSAERRLPEPAATSFFAGHQAETTEITPAGAEEVVLLIDSFTNHFTPEIAEAALAVLQRACYTVHLARPGTDGSDPERPLCCGRTYLANGLIEQARFEARRMLTALQPHAQAGRRIIGLEPSCLLTLREDYGALGLGREARTVAGQALLFEEFIAREITAKRFSLPLKPMNTGGEPLLVHGHCHQKAAGAMKSIRKALKAIPGLEFEFIEASCCGMAGSFGVEREHADIAMQMAELALLPTLRQYPRARILANGFSCRQQIREGSSRPSLHLAQLLQEALG
jgi:Fe-S oxidoreductase